MSVRDTLAAAVGAVALLAALAGAGPAAAQTTKYIAFGDSITEGVGDDADNLSPGYPARLQTLLVNAGRPSEVVNRGVGGERTMEGLSRIDSVLEEGADVILLMEGSNDVSRQVSLETVEFNLDEMGRRAALAGIEPVHATVIPRIPRARVDADNLVNQMLNEAIRDMAGLRRRRLVDNFEAFGKIDNVFAELYWDAADDFVGHPNADGYDVMAGVFFDVLTGRDSTPPVEGLIVPANGEVRVPSSEHVFVTLWDFGAGIDLSATSLLINDQEVPIEVSGDSRRAELLYVPPDPLANIIRVRLRSRDLATPANTVDAEIARFIIAGTRFLPGDMNLDGRVDGLDLVMFGLAFGSSRGSGRFNGRADLNADDVVDGEDLALFASRFGMSSF